MKKFRISSIAVLLFLTGNISFAAEIRLTEIKEFSEPLKLGHVMELHPGWVTGHGPYIWYKSAVRSDKEIWFWFQIPEKEISSVDYTVVLITIVDSKNPDDLEIIWPKRYMDKDVNRVFESIYKGTKHNKADEPDGN